MDVVVWRAVIVGRARAPSACTLRTRPRLYRRKTIARSAGPGLGPSGGGLASRWVRRDLNPRANVARGFEQRDTGALRARTCESLRGRQCPRRRLWCLEAEGGAASAVEGEGDTFSRGMCATSSWGLLCCGSVRAKVRAGGVRDRGKSIQTSLEGTGEVGCDLSHRMYITIAIERLQPPNSSYFRYPFLGHLADSESRRAGASTGYIGSSSPCFTGYQANQVLRTKVRRIRIPRMLFY